MWATTPRELESRLNAILERCQKLHVTLSYSKFQIDTTLQFAGCVISDKGVMPDPYLSNFPVPTDQTGVHLFLGLCNQLAFFVPDFQHHTVSLQKLTGKGRPFLWLPEHQVEFNKLKISDLVVWHFDSTKPVFLLTDVSRLFGLGYALSQIELDSDEKKIFKIVHYGPKASPLHSRDTPPLSWSVWPSFGQSRSFPFTFVDSLFFMCIQTTGHWKVYSKRTCSTWLVLVCCTFM